jgi:hypothetical protein
MSESRTTGSPSGVHSVKLNCVRGSRVTNVYLYTPPAGSTRVFKLVVKDGVKILDLLNTLETH